MTEQRTFGGELVAALLCMAVIIGFSYDTTIRKLQGREFSSRQNDVILSRTEHGRFWCQVLLCPQFWRECQQFLDGSSVFIFKRFVMAYHEVSYFYESRRRSFGAGVELSQSDVRDYIEGGGLADIFQSGVYVNRYLRGRSQWELWRTFEYQIGPLFDLKLLLLVQQCILGGGRSISSCVCGLFRLAVHEESEIGIYCKTEKSENLKYKRCPFTAFSALLAGFFLVGWGWWRIRFRWYGVRSFILGLSSFLIGVTLWAYSIPAILNWSTQF